MYFRSLEKVRVSGWGIRLRGTSAGRKDLRKTVAFLRKEARSEKKKHGEDTISRNREALRKNSEQPKREGPSRIFKRRGGEVPPF